MSLSASALTWDDETNAFTFAGHEPIDSYAYVSHSAAELLAAYLRNN